jgi:YegS/Rv2252/BmrU family lipid kinase
MKPQPKSTLVIYNPVAGSGRTHKYWPDIQNSLREANINFDAVATREPLDAITLAQQAQKKYSTVIGIGGDGTIHEIVNGLMRASGEGETIPLGVIPLGNGDDFSKMIPPETPIGGRPFDWQTAVNKIEKGQTHLFDVGQIIGDQPHPELGPGPHYFANSLDVGFGAQGAQNMLIIPKFFKGLAAYLAAIVVTLFNYPTLNLRIRLDDQEPFTQSSTMTAVMNGRCFGNGFWICPDARIDDGLFDLLISQEVGRLKIIRLVPKFMRGTHVDDPVLSMYRSKRVVIDTQVPIVVETDGEVLYPSINHLEIEILHKRLRVIV